MATKKSYNNESISSLKGADRVRKRPGVIFGSDGLEGCEHAVFEILSNAIDEAREGHGRLITVTRFSDLSIQVEDMGRGCPVDWNEKEGRYNWELVFCELYAGGKYDNENSENYEYSLGLNGLGSCATQYASRLHGCDRVAGGQRSIPCTLNGAKLWASCRPAPCPTAKSARPAPASTGCRIWMCLRTFKFPRTTTGM